MTKRNNGAARLFASEVPVPAAPRPKRLMAKPPSLVERKDGRHLRRMTLYLPPELAKQLRLYCAEAERDMSDVVTEAVSAHLPRKS